MIYLLPQNIGSNSLVIIDDCTIINSLQPSQLFVYGRPLGVNVIYLSQKYSKVLPIIRENANVFIFFKQNAKTFNKYLFPELGE